MITALLDVFERGGLEAVEALISDWEWGSIKKLHIMGQIEDQIYDSFRQAFTGADFPKSVWITPEKLKQTSEISISYRKSVRGNQIGTLD